MWLDKVTRHARDMLARPSRGMPLHGQGPPQLQPGEQVLDPKGVWAIGDAALGALVKMAEEARRASLQANELNRATAKLGSVLSSGRVKDMSNQYSGGGGGPGYSSSMVSLVSGQIIGVATSSARGGQQVRAQVGGMTRVVMHSGDFWSSSGNVTFNSSEPEPRDWVVLAWHVVRDGYPYQDMEPVELCHQALYDRLVHRGTEDVVVYTDGTVRLFAGYAEHPGVQKRPLPGPLVTDSSTQHEAVRGELWMRYCAGLVDEANERFRKTVTPW